MGLLLSKGMGGKGRKGKEGRKGEKRGEECCGIHKNP